MMARQFKGLAIKALIGSLLINVVTVATGVSGQPFLGRFSNAIAWLPGVLATRRIQPAEHTMGSFQAAIAESLLSSIVVYWVVCALSLAMYAYVAPIRSRTERTAD